MKSFDVRGNEMLVKDEKAHGRFWDDSQVLSSLKVSEPRNRSEVLFYVSFKRTKRDL
jgi:hypothetical protein